MKITIKQIEQLGWKITNKDNHSQNKGSYGFKGFLHFYINLNLKDHTPFIMYENNSIVFKGNCNTIADFKTILRLLNK